MLLEAIGNTPMIRLKHVQAGQGRAVVLAKAEFLNPSGSAKDRPARAIVMDGVKSGELTPDRTLLDATTGNMGVSFAMICAVLGYRAAMCLPRNANMERKVMLGALGAEIIETDPILGFEGAAAMARNIHARNPRLYFHSCQYNNEANWRAHYDTTGAEIWEQTGGRLSHFVAGVGTGGTFTGVARRLKAENPGIRAFIAQPDTPLHGLEGIRYLPSAQASAPQTIFDASLADGRLPVSTDEAREMTLRLARLEGLFVGLSSGANVAAALKLAAGLPEGDVVVTVLADTGFRYLSNRLWDAPRQKAL